MPRIAHGSPVLIEHLNEATERINKINAGLSIPVATISQLSRFDYLFPEILKDPANLLPVSKDTVANLIRLGKTMLDPGHGNLDSATPSIYTYFGQFVDHDITLEANSAKLGKNLNDPDLVPLPAHTIRTGLINTRTASLDLDSVYGAPALREGSKMMLGKVSPFKDRPPSKDEFNDLPRKPRSNDPTTDREALIGDPRNDENLIVAQLHVAFLRAHNSIVDRGNSFDEARRLLRQHYQWIVIHDFLNRVAAPEVVFEILNEGNKFFRPAVDDLFMPLEFSVAAFRFGHSMVRSAYDFNINFRGNTAAPLEQLFTFTAFSGGFKDFDSLPENWIIEWKNFLDEGTNAARVIDTQLVEPLFSLTQLGKPVPDEARLAVRNLLRGYMLRLPTGQAVARSLSLAPLTPAEIEGGASPEQAAVLHESRFSERTPLWYYILAESARDKSSVLGPIGSRLVSEVLIGLVRGSKDSILKDSGWKPTLGTALNRFTLRDLLTLGGVL